MNTKVFSNNSIFRVYLIFVGIQYTSQNASISHEFLWPFYSLMCGRKTDI